VTKQSVSRRLPIMRLPRYARNDEICLLSRGAFTAGNAQANVFNLDYDRAEFKQKVGLGGKFLAQEERILGLADAGALPKSAVGCSLSHIAAWERVAANTESAPLQIIVEDDGLPLRFNRAACGTTQTLMQQRELDLHDINDNATPLEFSIREFSPGWKAGTRPWGDQAVATRVAFSPIRRMRLTAA